MMIHDITAIAGRHKRRKRVGRGEGSGHGKQSGRGNKGAGSRSGNSAKKAFEGGQMPYFRRLPKFGFTNAPFKVQFWTVNLADILAHPAFRSGGKVDADSLIKAGLVRDTSRDLKILGAMPKGKTSLGIKLEINASRVSGSVRRLVLEAGGQVNEGGTRRDRVRGVDRNSDDHSPRNLTKKLKRSRKPAAPVAAAEESAQPAKGKDKPAPKPEGE